MKVLRIVILWISDQLLKILVCYPALDQTKLFGLSKSDLKKTFWEIKYNNVS